METGVRSIEDFLASRGFKGKIQGIRILNTHGDDLSLWSGYSDHKSTTTVSMGYISYKLNKFAFSKYLEATGIDISSRYSLRMAPPILIEEDHSFSSIDDSICKTLDLFIDKARAESLESVADRAAKNSRYGPSQRILLPAFYALTNKFSDFESYVLPLESAPNQTTEYDISYYKILRRI